MILKKRLVAPRVLHQLQDEAIEYLVRLGFQVFNVVLGSRQALVIGHVSLHHLVVRMLQKIGVSRGDGLREVIGLRVQSPVRQSLELYN